MLTAFSIAGMHILHPLAVQQWFCAAPCRDREKSVGAVWSPDIRYPFCQIAAVWQPDGSSAIYPKE